MSIMSIVQVKNRWREVTITAQRARIRFQLLVPESFLLTKTCSVS